MLRKENHSLGMQTFFIQTLPILSEHVHIFLYIQKSSAHVEFTFDNPAKNFLLKGTKKLNTLFYSKINPQNVRLDTQIADFKNLPETFQF